MKSLTTRLTFVGLLSLAALLHGCALRPSPGIPRDMTVADVMTALEKRAARIGDLSGTALVTTNLRDGASNSVKISIKYIGPDRFRILVKGFAGIPVALIGADRDSLKIFFPSENTYIAAERSENALGQLVPELNIDVNRLASLLIGTPPPAKEIRGYDISLEHLGSGAVLSMKSGPAEHRYMLQGGDLKVVAEETYDGGRVVWSRKASGFRTVNGVLFPRKISLSHESGTLDVEFSGVDINTGLAADDLSVVIPVTAERLILPGHGNTY